MWQTEEIAHNEQFLLLSQCFQKSSAAEASKSITMRERVIFGQALIIVWR